jgi:hypothetical protein
VCEALGPCAECENDVLSRISAHLWWNMRSANGLACLAACERARRKCPSHSSRCAPTSATQRVCFRENLTSVGVERSLHVHAMGVLGPLIRSWRKSRQGNEKIPARTQFGLTRPTNHGARASPPRPHSCQASWPSRARPDGNARHGWRLSPSRSMAHR